MPELVLGVDAGGTKTHACVLSARGTVLGVGRAGGANWESVGLPAMGRTVDLAVLAALANAGRGLGEITHAVLAMAGLDWPDDAGRIRAHLSPPLTHLPSLVNDAYAALAAGAPEGFGVVSVAGTGGLTAGRNQAGETFRTMGQLLGEAGGATGVVGRALEAVAQARNRVGPPTALSQALAGHYAVRDVEALFHGLTRGTLDLDSGAAPVIFRESRLGDAVARRIVRSVGEQHARDVVGVAERLGLSGSGFPVVRAGGVALSGDEVFDQAFMDTVLSGHPCARLVDLTVPPVAGAAVLALAELGGNRTIDPGLHARVVADVAAAFRVGDERTVRQDEETVSW